MKIIMYHYVRRPETTPFPAIKALHTDAFRAQIDWLRSHCDLISGHDLMRAVTENTPLPERAALLTFDDGYRDCLTDVAPILHAHNISACFFPVADCVENHSVLDVNKIQFILAAGNLNDILLEVRDAANAAFDAGEGPDWPELLDRFAVANRWDPPEVQLVKKLLQRELPDPWRTLTIQSLFTRHVTHDETDFAHELYCNAAEWGDLLDRGHFLGGHGVMHRWLDHLSPADQRREVEGTRAFLKRLGVHGPWCMCYPHGGHNQSLHHILQENDCRVGLTVTVRDANLRKDPPLELPRWNTNDFPPKGNAGI